MHNEFPLRASYSTKPAELLLQAKTLIPCSIVNCLWSPNQPHACIRETTECMAKYYRMCPAASLLLQLTSFSSGLILPGTTQGTCEQLRYILISAHCMQELKEYFTSLKLCIRVPYSSLNVFFPLPDNLADKKARKELLQSIYLNLKCCLNLEKQS